MSWLPKRDKLDPLQTSAIDFAVAQERNFYIRARPGRGSRSCWRILPRSSSTTTSKGSCCECQSWSDLFCQTPTTLCRMS